MENKKFEIIIKKDGEVLQAATENAAGYGIERRWQCEKLIELLESEGIK